MSCCCTKIKSIGCVSSCNANIDLNFPAPGAGTYTLKIETGATAYSIDKDFLSGANLEFDLDDLRCDSNYTLSVLDSFGDSVLDGDGNDCFSLQTKFEWNPQPAEM